MSRGLTAEQEEYAPAADEALLDELLHGSGPVEGIRR